ncbi:hypothetical protein AB0K89_18765 [Streptomyces cinnamoneus]|uniref:hypothetical protein n=1 Tax=Streptomyces cinnamoneus TaxID=53446 RepID=UPI003413E86B
MFSPRSLITYPRMLRHASTLSVGLPPDEAVVLDAPDAPLRAALAAAAGGDHEPARELLAATRLGMQWERRNTYVSALAEFALHHPGWLDAWLSAAPEDPDAVLVKADLCIHQAWEIRSGARAEHVSEDRFRGFFALLEDAVPVIGAAVELNPTDPVPWRVALTHARGSQAPREVFDGYWREATARSSHHFGCHASALQYLCEKWFGSHEEMFAFAEEAADQALPGSLLHALPLLAAVEYAVVASAVEDGPLDPDRIDAAVERALGLVSHYEAGDEEIAGVRNHLALMLARAGRWADALEQFRAIGVHATEFPWAYLGDAREQFLDFRTGVRIQVAMNTPLLGRPPQPAVLPGPAGAPAWESEHCSLAVVSATLDTVAEATSATGTPLRLATGANGWHTLVEVALDPDPARRGSLMTRDRLVSAAGVFTTRERWTALVLHRSGDRRGFTLVRNGDRLAEHQWDPAAPVPDLETTTATAETVARAYGLDDARPLISLLRGNDDAPRRQAELVAALRMPPLPETFGTRAEALTGLPGARIVARRKTAVAWEKAGTSGTAPDAAYTLRRPLRWWLLRLFLLPFFTALAVWQWQAGALFIKPLIAALAAFAVGSDLVKGWRQRPRS